MNTEENPNADVEQAVRDLRKAGVAVVAGAATGIIRRTWKSFLIGGICSLAIAVGIITMAGGLTTKAPAPYKTDAGWWRTGSIAKDQNKLTVSKTQLFTPWSRNVTLYTSNGEAYVNPATTKQGGPNQWTRVR